jgi:hypothetical protein
MLHTLGKAGLLILKEKQLTVTTKLKNLSRKYLYLDRLTHV